MLSIEERKVRNSNLELLRIISMILIVMSHMDEYMGIGAMYRSTAISNKLLIDWLNTGGQIGVGCFLLISGYFMSERQFSMKRILRLLGEVWFYTIGFWIFFVVVKLTRGEIRDPLIINQAVRAFFPVLSTHYWFVTAFIILMILSPFFNKLITAMDRRMYLLFLAVLVVAFFVLSGGFINCFKGMVDGKLIPACVMYFVGGYIKKYSHNSLKKSSGRHLGAAILGYILLYAAIAATGIIGDSLNSEKLVSERNIWYRLGSPLVLFINVELFLTFLCMKPTKNMTINSIASNTFGVFLIHQNIVVCWIVSQLCCTVYTTYMEADSPKLFLYAIASVAVVYIVCTLIDIVRQRTVEKLWIKEVEKFEVRMCQVAILISNRVSNRLDG